MQKTGGSSTDANDFSANFCNATGMFAYVSFPSGCYYQKTSCDIHGWKDNSVPFLGLVRDETFTLLINGINQKAVPVPGPGREVVWMVRAPACSGHASRDVNVTLAADNSLLSWSHGSSIVNPIDHSCSVANWRKTITQFRPTSDLDGAKVEAFVRHRIAVEGLHCKPFQR